MKECRGLWLPDHEQHLQSYIEAGPLVDGVGTYQLHKLELAMLHVKQWRRALDIGAHVGSWSRVLAMRFEQVDAFEPIPGHIECFERNVSTPNVTLHRCALGRFSGEIKVRTPSGNSGHSHVDQGRGEVVVMRTLDEHRFEDVDFMKLDVEGYELQVLRGGIDTLQRCRPTLIVEQKPYNGRRYGPEGDHGALTYLTRLGAKIVAKKAGDYVLVWP